MPKVAAGTLEATPSKRLYLSIIADYDLNRSICELVDNALDEWVRGGRAAPVSIDITLNLDQQAIVVQDNAGGVRESELKNIVAPGHTGSALSDETIGMFGVGTKRAVVALAQDIRITTRHSTKPAFRIELDDEWLEDDDNWDVPYYRANSIPAGNTIIEVNRLRAPLKPTSEGQLRSHLGATYAKFVRTRKVSITVNEKAVKPETFDDWSYPPKYGPKEITSIVKGPEGRPVKISILAGLGSESSPGAGEYGVYFYCNDRLVARGLKTFDVGFGRGMAGSPHPKISLTKVIVSLSGDARSMPWNSSKSDVDTKHPIFRAVQELLIQAVSDYARISRVWMGDWEENVFRYKSGEVQKVAVPDLRAAPRSFLPPPPKSRLKFIDKVKQKNAAASKKSPWTVGLYEGLVAANTMRRQKLATRNRLALVLIDTTLEIAMKDFLVHESGHFYPDGELEKIMKARHRVHQEVQKFISFDQEFWKKINWFYGLRCKLVHERATADLSDEHLDEFEGLAQQMLGKLHSLKF